MRAAGWFLVILGFALGFVLGFGVPLAEAVPALAPSGPPNPLAGWFQARPSWVAPMLLGTLLLMLHGWLRRNSDAT